MTGRRIWDLQVWNTTLCPPPDATRWFQSKQFFLICPHWTRKQQNNNHRLAVNLNRVWANLHALLACSLTMHYAVEKHKSKNTYLAFLYSSEASKVHFFMVFLFEFYNFTSDVFQLQQSISFHPWLFKIHEEQDFLQSDFRWTGLLATMHHK